MHAAGALYKITKVYNVPITNNNILGRSPGHHFWLSI